MANSLLPAGKRGQQQWALISCTENVPHWIPFLANGDTALVTLFKYENVGHM
jgi:hypothetical protein